MANRIRVSTEWLERCSRELAGIQSSIDNAASTLAGIQLRRDEGGNLKVSLSCSLKMTGGRFSGGTAADDIRQLQQAAKALSGATAQFSGGAAKAAEMLEGAEQFALDAVRALATDKATETYTDGSAANVKPDPHKFDGVQDIINQGASQQVPPELLARTLNFSGDPSKWTPEMKKKAEELLKDATLYTGPNGEKILVSGTTTAVLYASGAIGVTDSTWRERTEKLYNPDGSYAERKDGLSATSMFWEKKPDKDDFWSQKDTNGGKDYKLPSRERTLFEVSAESKASYSSFHLDGEYKNGNYSNSSSLDINKFEANAKISAGLYSTKMGPDGKEVRTLEPGIGAEIGVSWSAIEATHKGRYGNDVIGLDYGVGAKGPSASAKADAELGIVDGHLAAHAGASAEAIGGEISGEAGVDVLGVEAKVKGSLNYGIGAHADVGVHDGKFSCDVGASLGVGGGVKFEVDYGKAVDNAVTGLQNAYKGAKDTVEGIKGASQSLFGKNGVLRW